LVNIELTVLAGILAFPGFDCPVVRNNWMSLICRNSFNVASRIRSQYGKIRPVMGGLEIIIKMLCDPAQFLWLSLRPQNALAAEILSVLAVEVTPGSSTDTGRTPPADPRNGCE
jgi:hypothetical protein